MDTIKKQIAQRWFFSTVSFCGLLAGGISTGMSADVIWNAPTAGETVTQSSGEYATGTQTAEKTGAGTYLIDNKSNTTKGAITISEGFLKVSNSQLSGPIAISNGATLQFGSTNALGMHGGIPSITVHAGGSIDNVSGSYSNLQQLILSGGTIKASSPTTNVMGDFLMGSPVTVTADSTISANFMIRTPDAFTTAGQWDVQGASVLTVSGKMSLYDGGNSKPSNLIKSGTGTIKFTASSDRCPKEGSVIINNGTIELVNASALQSASITVNKSDSGTGALKFSGQSGTTANNIALAEGATFTIAGTGGGQNQGNTYALTGSLSGAGGINISGTYTDLRGDYSNFTGTLTTSSGWTFLVNSKAASAQASYVNWGGLYAASSEANQVYQFGMLTGNSEFRASGRAYDGAFAIEVGASNASGEYSGPMNNNGNRKFSIAKKGTGTWTLSNDSSTYSLGTSIDAGTIAVSKSSTLTDGAVAKGPLGTGAVTLNGGTLQSVTNNLTLHNPINVAKASTINTSSNLTLEGILTGSGNLQKSGNSGLYFAGNNSGYSGTITLSGGNTFLTDSASFANASFETNSGLYLIATTENRVFEIGMITGVADFRPSDKSTANTLFAQVGSTNASGTFSGLISNLYSNKNFGLIKVGTGTWTLTNSGSYYPGGTTISGGAIAINSSSALDNGAVARGPLGTGAVTLNGGTLLYNSSTADGELHNSLTVAAGTTSTIAAQNKFLDLKGNLSGTGNLNNNGSTQYVRFSGSNSGFSGTYTNIDNWSFFVTPQSSSETAIYQAGTETEAVGSRGFAFIANSADNNGNVFKLGMLTGNQEVRASGSSACPIILEIGGPLANGDETLRQQYAQRYSGEFSGYLNDCWDNKFTNIVKTGEGTWTLSGNQLNYSGTTTIDSGTLAINSQLKNSAVTVSDGGILTGTGEIVKSLLIYSGGEFEVDLIESAKGNVLNVGSATMSPGSIISFVGIDDPEEFTGLDICILESKSILDLSGVTFDFSKIGGNIWDAYFVPGTVGGELVMRLKDANVPEPASIVLLILGAVGIGLLRKTNTQIRRV